MSKLNTIFQPQKTFNKLLISKAILFFDFWFSKNEYRRHLEIGLCRVFSLVARECLAFGIDNLIFNVGQNSIKVLDSKHFIDGISLNDQKKESREEDKEPESIKSSTTHGPENHMGK